MNKVILTGFISRDIEVKYTTADEPIAIAKFSVACNRIKDGVDFINCVAFGKTAEFLEKYFKKGMGIELEGRIQTGSYKKDEKTVYTTDVAVEKVEFVKAKKGNESNDGFEEVNLESVEDDDLPF